MNVSNEQMDPPYRASEDIDEPHPDAVYTWSSGGSYLAPPDHCDLDKDPDEEYCPIHLEAVRRMAEFDPDPALETDH